MIGKLYDLLGKMGYIHPLHPPFTHGPIGGVIVAFCFGLGMLLWRRQNFLQSAYYAVAIALSHRVGRDYGLAILLFRSMDIPDKNENCSSHTLVHTLIHHFNCGANSGCAPFNYDASAYTLFFLMLWV